MHMSDALVSPPVAIGAGILSSSLLVWAAKKTKNHHRPDIVPLMGVMGAFVFAAQMINFTIPGTGSSGHLIGGILLSAILGPWCGFITLSSILIVQCLIFADGGLLALGCNILNMAVTSCLVAYPLVYNRIVGKSINSRKIITGSVLASLTALLLGAFAVTLETELSGITALPFSTFISFMIPIHFVIGIIEGLVTASLLLFIASYRPQILSSVKTEGKTEKNKKNILLIFGVVTLVLAASFSVIASEFPDGLEWAVGKVSSNPELLETETPDIALIPDYQSSFSGIIGGVIVMVFLWGISSVIFSQIRKSSKKINEN